MSVGGWFYDVGGERRGPVSLPRLKALVASREVAKTTMVWAEGMPEPVAAGSLPMLFPTGPDAATRWLLPVGRSGFAIAAGYLGLLSLIPFLAPLALVFAGLAIWDLRRHPEKSGWGRVVFGGVMGLLFSTLYALMFLGF
jgi:hypothetical protein